MRGHFILSNPADYILDGESYYLTHMDEMMTIGSM